MGDNSFAGINFNDSESPKIFEYHKKNMCSDIVIDDNSSFLSKINIEKKDNNGGYLVKGVLKDDLYTSSLTQNVFIKYIASNKKYYDKLTESNRQYFKKKIDIHNDHYRDTLYEINHYVFKNDYEKALGGKRKKTRKNKQQKKRRTHHRRR